MKPTKLTAATLSPAAIPAVGTGTPYTQSKRRVTRDKSNTAYRSRTDTPLPFAEILRLPRRAPASGVSHLSTT